MDWSLGAVSKLFPSNVIGYLFSVQEPVSLYGDRKFFSLAKLDRSITLASVKKFVEDEEAKYDGK